MDCGEQIVEELRETFEEMGAPMTRQERGFSTWFGGLRQRVWADEPYSPIGCELSRIHIRTDTLRGYSGDEDQIAYLNRLAPFAMLSGMVRDEEDRSRLQLASAVAVGDVHPQNASWLALRCAILQRVDAGVLAGHESFRPLDMDLTEHPSEGPCESDPREAITGFGPTVLEGQRPSSFKGAEIRDIKGECTMPPCVAARSDETEVVARYPFVCEVSTLRASASRAHSLFGSGLDIELLFPEKGWCRPFNLLDMNERDLDERRFIDFLGSWRLDGGNAIFHSFMPNGFFTPGAGQLQFRSMPTRARWYAENVCGDDWDAGGYRVACEFWQEQGKGARAKRWLGKLFGGRRR